ncbi:hypothetical protein KM043_012626 [Ampulex compressa]|nr:hypothetical protein KM043_012626 [Ampulex compressa]
MIIPFLLISILRCSLVNCSEKFFGCDVGIIRVCESPQLRIICEKEQRCAQISASLRMSSELLNLPESSILFFRQYNQFDGLPGRLQ